MSDKLSRREFLRNTLYAGASLLIPKELRNIQLNIPGDYSSKADQKSEQSSEAPDFTLPEKIVTDRVWEKINSAENSPPGYRQAYVWHPERQSFIVHGGWGVEGNTDQTWEMKNGQWKLLEQGSTPKMCGHKIVSTPVGIFMYGGVVGQNGGNISNKGYVLDESEAGVKWQEVVFDQVQGELPEARQGMGMVYDSATGIVWVVGGADVGYITANIAQIKPPETESGSWQFKRVRQQTEFGVLPPLFEPMVFKTGEEAGIMIYGGLRAYSNRNEDAREIYQLGSHTSIYNEIIGDLSSADWPTIDYAGPVEGGYDLKRKQLVLNGGATPNFFQTYWPESEVYDSQSKSWGTLPSTGGPRWVTRAATTMNEKGEVYRTGGAYYQNGQTVFPKETWVLKPIEKTYIPLVKN